MATPRTRWLLVILLVNLPNYVAPAGPPAPPSLPDCYIPCDENNCFLNIHCTWEPRQDPLSTVYSLHWVSANKNEGHVVSKTGLAEYIKREHFSSHDELRVWVQAKNQHGSAKSQESVFNTADIYKPPPPNITSNHEEPFEIYWNSVCDQLQLSLGQCHVRHRTEAEQVWLEDLGGFHGCYTFDSPQPCTVYEFQVRCSCGTGLTSNWSAIHRIESTETVPVGELDIWMDCGISAARFDCVLTWKELPTSQACGLILGYKVKLYYIDSTVVLNVSIAEPSDQLVCVETQCHFIHSLKDVKSVSVLAYNAHGATVPSFLAMPTSDEEKYEQAIYVRMNEENLTVFWDQLSQLSNNLKEFVVQYKQAGCPPGQGFDWVKVNKSQTTGVFKGQFTKYRPYQVSLFTVSHNSEVRHLVSNVGYSLQGTLNIAPSFQVLSIAATHVTLHWEPIPLSRQDGVILYYQIGKDTQNVYNVSASPQHENRTFELLHLSTGQEYEVWMRAVTAAGPGVKATRRFKTNHHEDLALLMPAVVGILFLFVICFSVVSLRACRGDKKARLLVHLCFYGKVPDPSNSQIFRQMKHQVSDPLTWICFPVHEPHPKISLLEVVEIQPGTFKSSLEKTSNPEELTRPLVQDGYSQDDCQNNQREDVVQEVHRTDHRSVHRTDHREAYSKMIDSDEEEVRENSSDEEQYTSGYEKHFMPTVLEILEV